MEKIKNFILQDLNESENLLPNEQKKEDTTPMWKSEFKVSIPDGFENDVRKVESGAYATAIIDNSGDLKFWFNSPF